VIVNINFILTNLNFNNSLVRFLVYAWSDTGFAFPLTVARLTTQTLSECQNFQMA